MLGCGFLDSASLVFNSSYLIHLPEIRWNHSSDDSLLYSLIIEYWDVIFIPIVTFHGGIWEREFCQTVNFNQKSLFFLWHQKCQSTGSLICFPRWLNVGASFNWHQWLLSVNEIINHMQRLTLASTWWQNGFLHIHKVISGMNTRWLPVCAEGGFLHGHYRQWGKLLSLFWILWMREEGKKTLPQPQKRKVILAVLSLPYTVKSPGMLVYLNLCFWNKQLQEK